MILIHGRAVTYGEIWFDEEPPPSSPADVLMFRQRPTPLVDSRCSLFLTLVSDITLDEARIMAGFGESNRYKIRRAETKDGIDAAFVTDPKRYLDEFCDFYDTFARQKSIGGTYRRGLEAAAQARQLVLTSASRNDERLVWHAYVMHGKRAALLHSASHFRGKDNEQRAVCGRANRWLHWRDMLGFREIGIERYDWGGLFEDESVPEQASINKFKCEFGGVRERTYNCALPVTLKGRLYLMARGARKRLGIASHASP